MSSQSFRFARAIEKVDILPQPIPGFNVRGKTEIYTKFGGLVSIGIITVMICFATVKFIQLESRSNPLISQVLQEGFYTESDKFNTTEENFRLAFTLEDYSTGKQKADPKYIKLFARVTG